jgi:putative peptide zinc metalloprotease protein
VAEAIFSPSWYRVASLKPRLRAHAHISRHNFRGELWFVLQDHSKGRSYRFTPEAYQIIGAMDGKRTVQELWENAAGRFGDDAPTQVEMVQLLSRLHMADVLLCDVPPDTAELLKRSQKIQKARWRQNLRSPMALRFPLLDPERFLARTVWAVKPLFTTYGALLWLAVVGSAVLLAGFHWSELTENVMDRVLSAQNLLILGLAYPVVKALHEFGHGYMVKAWGGEVHEMGIMLLVLMPIPYVDASAASEFRAKHRRVLVGAAGMIVELFLAAVALFLWLSLDAGMMRSVAYNVILIGSVSTVLFNGNPLLRYDGYYIFADLVEIPNLAQRGLQYLGFLIKRYVLGLKKEKEPYAGPGERPWFVIYSLSAFIYRMFIYVAIILFIAGKFFVIGVLLALWAASSMVVTPVFKGAKFILASPTVRENRSRALAITGLVIGAVALLLFVVPFPSLTRAEGVIWVPEESLVRAGTSGFVVRVVVPSGTEVEAGQVLIRCRDPLLNARVKVLEARLGELLARYDAALSMDRVQARVIQEEITSTRAELARAEERLQDLDVRSPAAGHFLLPQAEDLPGRHVRQGDLVAYVIKIDRPTIRVVVPQSSIDLVRRRTREVELRLVERVAEIVPATIKREVPEAAEQLPSTVLGRGGGGRIAIDPTDSAGTRTFEKLFQFDIEPLDPIEQVFIGGRVYVRFNHGFEPLAFQWYRSIRQLFLRRFNV